MQDYLRKKWMSLPSRGNFSSKSKINDQKDFFFFAFSALRSFFSCLELLATSSSFSFAVSAGLIFSDISAFSFVSGALSASVSVSACSRFSVSIFAVSSSLISSGVSAFSFVS